MRLDINVVKEPGLSIYNLYYKIAPNKKPNRNKIASNQDIRAQMVQVDYTKSDNILNLAEIYIIGFNNTILLYMDYFVWAADKKQQLNKTCELFVPKKRAKQNHLLSIIKNRSNQIFTIEPLNVPITIEALAKKPKLIIYPIYRAPEVEKNINSKQYRFIDTIKIIGLSKNIIKYFFSQSLKRFTIADFFRFSLSFCKTFI